LMELGWLEAIVVVLAMLLASTVFSATGFGIGMISTPLMLLVYEPQTVIVVAGTAGLGIGLWIISKSWRDVPFREILPITIAALCGAPIAVFILKTADSSVLSIGIAVLIILFAIGSFVKVEREIPYSKQVGIAAGFIVGVLLPTSGVAGSLVMLFLMTRNWERQTVRAAMAFFLVSLMAFTVVLFALYGLYTPLRLTLIGIVAIPAVIGFLLGAMLIKRINERVFGNMVIGIIIVSSIIVVVKEVSKYL
jgi:uncharacterized membrane protein YfcA